MSFFYNKLYIVFYPEQQRISAIGKVWWVHLPRWIRPSTPSSTSGRRCTKVVHKSTPPPKPKSKGTIRIDLKDEYNKSYETKSTVFVIAEFSFYVIL